MFGLGTPAAFLWQIVCKQCIIGDREPLSMCMKGEQMNKARIHNPCLFSNDYLMAKLNTELRGFEILLQKGKESLGIGTINYAVIVRQSEVSHLPDGDIIVAVGRGQDLCTLFDRSDAEYRDLRLIDDRGSIQPAEDAGVGN